MGTAFSFAYGQLRRTARRYNAENRAHKFLQKEKLPAAPRHPCDKQLHELLKEKPEVKKELEELNIKNEQLDEYLKKVYLTSPPEKTVKSTRPLPMKRRFDLKQMFYEPEIPTPGFCTLSNIIELMAKFQGNPKKWNATNLAEHYGLNKADVVHLLTYYSLFKKENFEFMNQEGSEMTVEKKEIEFSPHSQLEAKPLKQIEGKK